MERLSTVEKYSGLGKECGKEDTEAVLTLGQDENLLSEEVDKEMDSETEDESDEVRTAIDINLLIFLCSGRNCNVPFSHE